MFPERLLPGRFEHGASINLHRDGNLVASKTFTYRSSPNEVIIVHFEENVHPSSQNPFITAKENISTTNHKSPRESMLLSPTRAGSHSNIVGDFGALNEINENTSLPSANEDESLIEQISSGSEMTNVFGNEDVSDDEPVVLDRTTPDANQHNFDVLQHVQDLSINEAVTQRHFQKHNFVEMWVDLLHLLQVANAPQNLFDKIMERGFKNHHSNLSIQGSKRTRLTAMKHLMKKVYNDDKGVLPLLNNVCLSSGRHIKVTKFSLRTAIVEMLSDSELMTADNLLWDTQAPWSLPPQENNMYGKPNTRVWHRNAIEFVKRKFCGHDKVVLLPLAFFIDGLKIDKYSKLKCEAVIGNWLIFNRKCRNKVHSWFLLGFIEDQGCFKNPYSAKEKRDAVKIQDYHDMLNEIFMELKEIPPSC